MRSRYITVGCRSGKARTELWLNIVVVSLVVGLLVALLMPALSMVSRREWPREIQLIKQLGIAFKSYQAAFDCFPPLGEDAGDPFGPLKPYSGDLRDMPNIEELINEYYSEYCVLSCQSSEAEIGPKDMLFVGRIKKNGAVICLIHEFGHVALDEPVDDIRELLTPIGGCKYILLNGDP